MSERIDGDQLKALLGIESLTSVYYSRLIGVGAYTIYFIFFDSRNPTTMLTSVSCHAKEFPTVAAFNDGGRMSLTMVRPIDHFYGFLHGSIFLRVDISGKFNDPLRYQESQLLVEDMTLKDFKSAEAMSKMTQRFAKERRKTMGGENIASKFVNVIFSVSEDWVEFQFLSDATATDKNPKEVDPNDFSMRLNPSRTYEIYIRVEKFFTWIFQTLPNGQSVSREDIKTVMENNPCKIWCNSPAFHWQGCNSNLTQVGAALHPTSIEPKFWNQEKYHGQTYFLDKSSGSLIRQIDFFMNPMASMLNKKLKDAGII